MTIRDTLNRLNDLVEAANVSDARTRLTNLVIAVTKGGPVIVNPEQLIPDLITVLADTEGTQPRADDGMPALREIVAKHSEDEDDFGQRAHHFREGYLDGVREMEIAKAAYERGRMDMDQLFGGFGL